VFAVQDEISENIARALDQTFSGDPTRAIDPAVHDLYLRASPKSYAPDEVRTHVAALEEVTERAPQFAGAGAGSPICAPGCTCISHFAERGASASAVARAADRTLALDPQNIDAMTAKLFVVPPYGRFVEGDEILDRIRRAPGTGDGRRYVGWFLRTMGRMRESLEEAERTYRLDALDPMVAIWWPSRGWPPDTSPRRCPSTRTWWSACPR
jgi:hypothetical protein